MIIGIDPGKKAGLAVVDGGELLVSATVGMVGAWDFYYEHFTQWEEPRMVVIEKPYSPSRQSIHSLGVNAGYHLCTVHSFFNTLLVPWREVAPARWHKDLGVAARGSKASARELAMDLWGDGCPDGQDEIDAALIALWGERFAK